MWCLSGVKICVKFFFLRWYRSSFRGGTLSTGVERRHVWIECMKTARGPQSFAVVLSCRVTVDGIHCDMWYLWKRFIISNFKQNTQCASEKGFVRNVLILYTYGERRSFWIYGEYFIIRWIQISSSFIHSFIPSSTTQIISKMLRHTVYNPTVSTSTVFIEQPYYLRPFFYE